MLERNIERNCGNYARDQGVMHLKFTSPGRAAVPDRLVLAQIPDWLVPVVAKYICFIEYKRKGQEPTVPQQREHARLRALGFTVHVIDNTDDGKVVIDAMGDK